MEKVHWIDRGDGELSPVVLNTTVRESDVAPVGQFNPFSDGGVVCPRDATKFAQASRYLAKAFALESQAAKCRGVAYAIQGLQDCAKEQYKISEALEFVARTRAKDA